MEVKICSSVQGGGNPTVETVVDIEWASAPKKATEEEGVTGTVGLMLSGCPRMAQFMGLLSHTLKYLNLHPRPQASMSKSSCPVELSVSPFLEGHVLTT